MKLMCSQPIRLRADLTLAPGDEFEADEHALNPRDVAELLAIGAATVVPLAELAEPAAPAKPAKAAAAAKAAK